MSLVERLVSGIKSLESTFKSGLSNPETSRRQLRSTDQQISQLQRRRGYFFPLIASNLRASEETDQATKDNFYGPKS